MLVSILIPCFNAADLIGECIESALGQTWPDKEVIVVDDGSTDRSLDVIRRYDSRIRWETGPNRGANATRNRLLELSQGRWLQYLDADDYLRPGKIEQQLKFVNEHPDCDVVYSATASELSENAHRIIEEHEIKGPMDPWIRLAHWDLPQTGGALWRKSILQQVGGWRVGQPCCQEHELYCRLLAIEARFGHCPGCLAVYRFSYRGDRISDRLGDEVHRQRLLILDRIEEHLRMRGELSAMRHNAINDTRHAAARQLWRHRRAWARDIGRKIRASNPEYFPWRRPASPVLYSLIYRAFGFETAQRISTITQLLR
jgi:glycosyltransferase involved in cell wall biosynthesis